MRELRGVGVSGAAGLLALLIVATTAAPAAAAIAFVQNLGTNAGFGTQLTITTTGSVTAGNSIIVSVSALGTGAIGVSCSDQAGNVYTTDVTVTDPSPPPPNQVTTAICSRHGAAALPAGQLITINLTSDSGDIVA